MSDEKLRKLVNVDEMAGILGVSKWWLYDRTSKGQKAIPHYKLGKYLRFDVEEVMQFFAQKRNSCEDQS
ncbi:MAG: helix-turn-helix domain-containing protein [Candidatus Omnitrophica bacterium]|nr:helix-turn-helix domain-containing protein [Candidatus Omnitrophota bacterium]